VTADIRERVAAMQDRGVSANELDAIRSDLALLESRLAAGEAKDEVS
jgi:hypothetical protein